MNNASCYFAGIAFLTLAKNKHVINGYSSPKPITDVASCMEYDIHIAQRYLEHLAKLGETIQGKRVLELKPGSDLGVGLLLLRAGAQSYAAFDRFALAKNTPREIYEGL